MPKGIADEMQNNKLHVHEKQSYNLIRQIVNKPTGSERATSSQPTTAQ
jgi:hypothetical protein